MRERTAREIRMILQEDFNVDPNQATDSAKFEDLEMDSLDMTGFAMALEEAFTFDIPKEDIKKLVTINDAVNYVEANSRG